eukprot:TRINITY_DN3155_c0_g2_i1.p2 TRINITY_DN3155_c0_g2~~TRINITY_DN3155_c0_g2_i1.p2  ORF type:complete len:189 (+),score=71.70 TRINITY_DN3155_c0_g2_i1:53-568(+)
MAIEDKPAEFFAKCCEARRVKRPNKTLVKEFGKYTTLSEVREVNLSGHYLGTKQVMAVVDLLIKCRNLSSLVVSGMCCYAADLGGIWHGTKSGEVPTGNEVWTHLLDMARMHPTLAHLDVSDNDCGPLVGRLLEAAVKDNKHLVRVTHDNVLIDKETLAAIDAHVERNAKA